MVQGSTFGTDKGIWLKANWNLSVISNTLSLNLGVVQVLAFVATENSMFDSQFSLFTRTWLHNYEWKTHCDGIRHTFTA
jgi:hypothetical protein